MKRILAFLSFKFLVAVRLRLLAISRKQLLRKRTALSQLAGNKVLHSPYNMIFLMIDKEIMDIDGELTSLKAAHDFAEFNHLEDQRELQKYVGKGDAALIEAEEFLSSLRIEITEENQDDVAAALNFLETYK